MISAPSLLMLSIRRLSLLKALGAAALAYFTLGFVEPWAHRMLSELIRPDEYSQLVIDFAVGFLACACGGFLATWICRGSAVFYSTIGTGFMATMVTNVGAELPVWYLAAFLVIALIAPVLGGIAFVAWAGRPVRPKP